jgi:SAM-dependent methyltransferase
LWESKQHLIMEAKAREIIERAMADRAVYNDMAAREKEVWGNILPSLERSEARTEDAAAAAKLRVNRYHSSLTRIARNKGLKFRRGLTLGCGSGRLERALVADGICQSFHGIDISEKAIADAREWARAKGFPITYQVADLNSVKLPEKSFDLVVAQTALHHVLFLEHVAEQSWRALQSDGCLWIHDFIGETQGQYEPKRLAIINQILAILPEKFRLNRINGKLTSQIKRPAPGKLGSPFEKIRSEEIVATFERWFTIEWSAEFNSLLDLVGLPGTRVAFAENDDTKALFEILILLDQLCIEEQILKPTAGQYLMRPRLQPL